MRRPPPASHVRRPARAFAHATAAAALAFAAVGNAQVFKCLDTAGRVTYQQAPCASGQQGRALNLVPDNGSGRSPETIAQWNAAVAEKRVVNGMTRQWVIQALGSPGEKRGPRANETASEVWVYPSQNDVLRVGFFGDAVAWQSRDTAKAGAFEAPRNPQARDKVASGQSCDDVRADLGPADREETIGDVDPKTGQARGLPGTRYSYEPIDGGVRLSFSCIQNKVLDVERGVSTLR